MVIFCIDYGSRHVGLAITDPDGRIALRYSVIDQKKSDLMKDLFLIIQKERVEKILVGVPIDLSGKETSQTHESLDFIKKLRVNLDNNIEIEEVDETLTSVEAANNLRAEGSSQNEEHAEAARLMLESYLRQKQLID